MDLSQLRGAMASKSYDKIADICDELRLQVASTQGIAFQQEWPYAVHLLGHIYVNDLNSARFLWKSIPSGIKERNPEVVAVWKIGQCLWTRDYAGVYIAVRGFNWSPEVLYFMMAFSVTMICSNSGEDVALRLYTRNQNSAGSESDRPIWTGFWPPDPIWEIYKKRMFQLLLSAYSTISVADAAHFMGMNEEDAANYAVQQGWTLDPITRMLTIKKKPIVKEQKVDPSKLQRLTEYVFHLEH